MNTEKTWANYYEQTKEQPPSALLVEAFSYIGEREKALDLGAGALKDTRYLLAQNFKHITIVDSEDLVTKLAKELSETRVTCIVSSYEQFEFPRDTYNLVNAQFSIPFNPPESFDIVFSRIKSSLKADGIFTGQLFGDRDEWNTDKRPLTFHNRAQAEELFSNMQIITFKEVERDAHLANGTPKHWHYYDIIAKK